MWAGLTAPSRVFACRVQTKKELWSAKADSVAAKLRPHRDESLKADASASSGRDARAGTGRQATAAKDEVSPRNNWQSVW